VRAAIRRFVPAGREAYVDAAFAVGNRTGISPWLLLGTLHAEGRFGRALTEGPFIRPRNGGGFELADDRTGFRPYTGDFIPRIATAALDAFMAAHPVPGIVRRWHTRAKTGNLTAYTGDMWVPTSGMIGWGWTPWQLDWKSFARELEAGAARNPEKATAAATALIKSNIRTLKNAGFVGTDLVRAVIVAYNAGAGRVISKRRQTPPVPWDEITAKAGYVDEVLTLAQAAGVRVVVA